MIKLSETQFVNSDGTVERESRFINSEVSSTANANESMSQIVLLWDSDVCKKVSIVKTGSLLGMLKMIATLLLASERVYAMYKRA